MDARDIARRYALIRAEIERRMTPLGKWEAIPALLDELHELRLAYRSARAASH